MRGALVIASALFALANLARAILATQQLVRLPDLPVAAPPAYIALMSIFWAVAFAVCAFGLAYSRRWAARVTIMVIVSYQANLWLNHLAFARASEAYARAGFGVLLSLLSILGIGGAALWLDRRQVTRQADKGLRADTHPSSTSET